MRGVTLHVPFLASYVVGVLAISFNTSLAGPGLGVGAFTSVLLGVGFLVSLPVLAYVHSAGQGRHFVAPSVMVVLLFLSYGLLTGYVLILGLA